MDQPRLKCTACKRVKFESDFIKNKKVLKTCITCREKNTKKTMEVNETIMDTIIPEISIEKIELLSVTLSENKIESSGKWYTLSGKWIQHGDELRLHKRLTKKLIRHFNKYSAFSVHKYLTKWMMTDIRDTYRPTCETVYQ